jgi:hypothetical protein
LPPAASAAFAATPIAMLMPTLFAMPLLRLPVLPADAAAFAELMRHTFTMPPLRHAAASLPLFSLTLIAFDTLISAAFAAIISPIRHCPLIFAPLMPRHHGLRHVIFAIIFRRSR